MWRNQAGAKVPHGLIPEQVIEDAYRKRVLSVIVATSTLGAGINLPAARVIFRSINAGGRPMEIASYRQMAGRAGRAGQAQYGESFLIARWDHKRMQPARLEKAFP
jgi:replicative superfamily II helicase